MLIIIQSLIGFFISLLILYFNPRNKFLALFFILNYLHGFLNYVLFFSGDPKLISLFLVNAFPIFYLIGPSFFFFIRGVQTENNSFKKSDWIHLIPFFISIFFTIPYTLQEPAIKLGIANEFMNGKVDIFKHFHLGLPRLIWYFTFRHLFSLLYITYFGIFFCKKLYNQKLKISPRAQKWFYFFVTISILIHFSPFAIIIKVGRDLNYRDGQEIGFVLYTFLGLILNLSIFFFPEILYGSFLKSVKKDRIQNPKQEIAFSKEEISLFEKSLKSYLLDKPFLDVNFNKSKVMVDLDISDRFFTYYFNDYLGINFNHWKSDLRIDESIQLINQNYLKSKTIESLANHVGFQSRNSFAESFKQKTGFSPSHYLSKVKK